tara:strand:+ start:1269 stop:1622 length:354 start_codon:yes stop_codon:yes gene_type:complete
MAFTRKSFPTIKGTTSHASALKQEGPIDEKQMELQPSEHKDTWVYDPTKDDRSSKDRKRQERIIDLEGRISFIKEDIWNKQSGPADAPADESQGSEQQKKDLATLRQELAILRKSKH